MISTHKLYVAYGSKNIVKDLSISIPSGKITVLIGPNGSGKSTLLKALCRINKAKSGEVLIDQTPLNNYPSRQLAQRLCLLPQLLHSPEGITVRRLVEYGRSPYISHWGVLNKRDRVLVDEAMQETGVFELAEHKVESLSGGQRQRAWVAMVIAQDTEVIMLDEPTTYLDLSHQVELMKLMQTMKEKGKTIILVLHDLNQACRYSDYLVVLNQGEVVAEGSPQEIFSQSLLKQVFNLDALVVSDPVSSTPMCVPL
ncbi:Fe(3+) dicitrate ABC transporter ATP-binding protein FecE [Spartinivicinus poritis]|uniref:Fe(3+) dicitrate ABC transporter ATP-binding protein FecE n=1 Tax=Spartinivicinus poritis TaxID=2994640 RepID=A0ABT5U9R9_9GAMM|nr:Fe(3+) dicitrate ABC transporter ATP-binding protein FecE [Spartinivicinus sp. A2-2]MDE1463121.1 Fe(3+) dicitrate ABC transporter ATP-binding protein FecE [Spartinivicinus sp. A2-2]